VLCFSFPIIGRSRPPSTGNSHPRVPSEFVFFFFFICKGLAPIKTSPINCSIDYLRASLRRPASW